MGRIGVCLALGLAAAVMTAAMPQHVAAESAAPAILKKLEGRWSGKGKMRPYVDSEPEPVTCQAQYRFIDDDPRMQLQMSCATVNAKSHLVAFFNYGAQSGVQGSWFQKWSTAQAEESGTFDGSASPSDMDLDVVAAGKKRAEIKVSLDGARSHSVSVVGIEKGTASQSFTITFNR